MKLVNKIKKNYYFLESELTINHNDTYKKKNNYNINQL